MSDLKNGNLGPYGLKDRVAVITGGSSVAYCASKAGLDTMAISLGRALGPAIRIINISPAGVDTDFVPGRSREGFLRHVAQSPLKTICQPDDVAMAVVAAVTHLRLVTGTSLQVDGGSHL